MYCKVGDLVKMSKHNKHVMGVVISTPIQTPNGFTVKVAVNGKVFPVYTWSLEIIDKASINTSI